MIGQTNEPKLTKEEILNKYTFGNSAYYGLTIKNNNHGLCIRIKIA